MEIRNTREKEDLILEAICDNFWTIQSISDHTEIPWWEVGNIIRGAGLVRDIKQARKDHEYGVLAKAYHEGMKPKELREITGIAEHRVSSMIRKIKEELEAQRSEIVTIIHARSSQQYN